MPECPQGCPPQRPPVPGPVSVRSWHDPISTLVSAGLSPSARATPVCRLIAVWPVPILMLVDLLASRVDAHE